MIIKIMISKRNAHGQKYIKTVTNRIKLTVHIESSNTKCAR